MPYCPKCGAKVSDEMAFCPKCGATLKAEKPPVAAAPAPAPPIAEKAEKAEKREKGEKTEKREKEEKHEKGEFGILAPLIGGLILIFLGLMSYLQITGILRREVAWASFLIIIGVVIIVGALYATRRHPRP